MANPYFNAVYYLQQNPDVFAAGYTVDTAWNHYAQFGANEGYANGGTVRAPNPWFDVKYYLNNNPDLIAAGITPAMALDHFTTYGMTAAEDRAPNATVAASPITEASLLAYANANADLQTAFGIPSGATELTAAQQNALISHFYQYGYDEDRPSAPTTVVIPDPNQGQTFTLTSGADQADTTGSSKNGGLISSDFKFTSANETVTAAAGTLNATDVLADGSTTDSDVLDATLTGAGTVAASITNVETINANVKTATGGLDLVSVSGAKALNVNTNVGIAAALDNVDATAAPVIGLAGSGVLTVTTQTLAGTTAGNNAESLSVKLDGATTSGTGAATQRAGITLDTLVAGALETLNLESAGDAKNTLVLALDAAGVVPTGITKTVVTGEADLDLRVAHSLITGQTLDAAGHEGALNLIVDRNAATTAPTNFTNVSGVDTYTFRDSTAGGDAMVASGLVDGANVVLTYGTTGASSLAVRGAAAGSSDSLTLTLDHATASTDVAVATSLTIADVETVNLVSEGGTTTGNSIAALTVKSGSTVTVDGSTKLSLELAAASTVSTVEIKGSGNHAFDFAGASTYTDGKNLTVDGSAATGKLSIDGRDFTGTAAGTGKEVLTITGGSGDDTIIATANGDATNVIDAGAGKDTVQVLGAASKTTVTLGDGVDTLNLAGATRNTTVTDFALGSGGDKLSVDTTGAVTFGGVGAAAVNNQLIVLNASQANDAAVQAILDAATVEVAVLAINDATGIAELWHSVLGTTADSVKLASFDNITTVGMLTDTTSGFVADNFGTWA